MSVIKTIYYHHTDAGGVVYYGRYLSFLEEARTVFLDGAGFAVPDLLTQGFIFVVRRCDIQYKTPARYGDVLVCDARPKHVSNAKIVFDQTISFQGSGQTAAQATVELVCVSRDTFKPTRMPEALYQAVKEKEADV